MSEEIWRAVSGFPDYDVSDQGRVRSWRRPGGARRAETPRLLKPANGGPPVGYLQVSLCGGSRARSVRVHVLVAEAFIGPRPGGMQVAHTDGDATNNAASNLRYATPSENNQDKTAHGRQLRGARHSLARLTEKQVVDLRHRASSGESIAALAIEFGISRRHAYQIKDGVRWAHVA